MSANTMMNATSNSTLVDDVFDESLHLSYKSRTKDATSSHGSSGDSTLHNSSLEVCAEEDEGHEDVRVKSAKVNGALSQRSSSASSFKNTLTVQNGHSLGHSRSEILVDEADRTYG